MISSTVLEYHPPQFVMPISIPTREQWIPDSKVTNCMLCKVEKFSMVRMQQACYKLNALIVNTIVLNTS